MGTPSTPSICPQRKQRAKIQEQTNNRGKQPWRQIESVSKEDKGEAQIYYYLHQYIYNSSREEHIEIRQQVKYIEGKAEHNLLPT
jgi:hypothetical protein